jgi:predicted porin
MKYHTCLTAVAVGLTMASAAGAQSITLYGVLDTGVEHVTSVGPEGGGLTRVPTITGTIPSRWGIRGSEDLGGGMKALFALESGIGMDGGTLNQGGRLFGLQSWVGLSGPWGQITLGRQLTMLLVAFYDTDVLGPNIFGIGSFDNYLPNARADNALAYKGKFGGVTVGAMYSPGRDTVNAGPSPSGTNCAGETAGGSTTCRGWSALLAYEQPGWGANIAADTMHGGPGAFGGLTRADLKDERLAAGGYLRLSKGKVAFNWIRRSNDAIPAPRSDLLSAGISYDVGPGLNLAAEAVRLRYRATADKSTLYAVRGTYALSKRTALYATAGLVENGAQLAFSVSAGAPGANPLPGQNQVGTMIGIRHTF